MSLFFRDNYDKEVKAQLAAKTKRGPTVGKLREKRPDQQTYVPPMKNGMNILGHNIHNHTIKFKPSVKKQKTKFRFMSGTT